MSWMSWQIDYLLLLQNFRELTNGFFDVFFLVMSQLGVAPFSMIFVCAIYWAINKKLGIYMLYCACFSYLVNMILKFTFCIYRPWLIDSRIHPLDAAFKTAPGYSFPSGHTSGALASWGAIGAYFRDKKRILYTCLVIIFLIMLSRNYLGVHTPQDVIVSFFVGIFILFGVEKIMKYIEQRKNADIIVLTASILICILTGLYISLKSYPTDYINGVLLYSPLESIHSAIGTLFYVVAIIIGCFLERRYINFEPEKGSVIRKILIVFIGIILLFSIDYVLHRVFAYMFDKHALKYIISFIMGFFIAFIYPCLIRFIDNVISVKSLGK